MASSERRDRLLRVENRRPKYALDLPLPGYPMPGPSTYANRIRWKRCKAAPRCRWLSVAPSVEDENRRTLLSDLAKHRHADRAAAGHDSSVMLQRDPDGLVRFPEANALRAAARGVGS